MGGKKSPPANPEPASAVDSQQVALITAQIMQQLQQQQAAAPSALAAPGGMTPETLQAIASLVSSSTAGKSLLPNTAPVSSLLPPVPGMNAATQAAMTSQIASIIAQATPPTAAPRQPDPAAIAAAAQHLAAVAAAAAQQHSKPPALPTAHLLRQPTASAPISSGLLPTNMQSWSLEQLQQHVNMLEQLGHPVPQTVSLLLADAKRKEEKKNAKRIANRKSASTSRARKKAYVQEMTELNARLKRQALILSLLPDMVIVIGPNGEISFSSAQVERVLRYDTEELVGKNISTLIEPASREKLNRLVKRLMGGSKAEAANMLGTKEVVSATTNEASLSKNEVSAGGGNSGVDNASAAAPVSEPSFPLSVVKVEAKPAAARGNTTGTSDDQNSDTSTSNPGKQMSSLTASGSGSSAQSGNGLFLGSKAQKDGSGGEEKDGSRNPSSDLSNSSSLSTHAKNVQQANTNLERNVRWHNNKMKTEKSGYKDDVTGADVTANNASARLSSLQHRPESSSSEEDDSGYRESNDSREETSSSVSDSSGSNGRRKPLAPTCNVCLIRKDRTTIWCEVTSSIRTKEPEDDADSISGDSKKSKSKSATVSSKSNSDDSKEEEKAKEPIIEKELLLCLRPIHDGDEKIQDTKIVYDAKAKKGKKKRSAPDGGWEGDAPASPNAASTSSRPLKKRGMGDVTSSSSKETKSEGDPSNGKAESQEMDTDAAESLMMMNKNA